MQANAPVLRLCSSTMEYHCSQNPFSSKVGHPSSCAITTEQLPFGASASATWGDSSNCMYLRCLLNNLYSAAPSPCMPYRHTPLKLPPAIEEYDPVHHLATITKVHAGIGMLHTQCKPRIRG